jgi:hypothetical protein
LVYTELAIVPPGEILHLPDRLEILFDFLLFLLFSLITEEPDDKYTVFTMCSFPVLKKIFWAGLFVYRPHLFSLLEKGQDPWMILRDETRGPYPGE